jgi:alkanesulfonate monooxygenase SsuD/methylene tetrahydromethanopterin reductase-like flavin-dependent oxidoreductase (luciferase family)
VKVFLFDYVKTVGEGMTRLGKLSFEVFLPFYAFEPRDRSGTSSFDVVRNMVLECERLGYHSIHVDDHLAFGKKPIFECWTSLSALSAYTTRIRLGTTVLAKMAATLDVISNGRLDLGIGAGVQESEHTAYGITFPEPNIRIERLKEAVIILKKMWTEEKATFTGKHYRINNAICEPKPVQKPHPPITIGGSGEKLTLRIQAQYADRIDWGYLPTLELYTHKLQILQDYCNTTGRDFQEIQKSTWLGGQIFIAENEKELNMKIQHFKPKNVTLDTFKKLHLVGTPGEFMQKIQQYTDLGVTHFMLFFGDFPCMEGMRIFAEKVLKKYNLT